VLLSVRNPAIKVAAASRSTLPVHVIINSACECTSPQPLSTGIPFPKGAIKEDERFCLRDWRGREIPVQTSPLARWKDGSVKWLLADFLVESISKGETHWELERIPGQSCCGPEMLHVDELADVVRVETGAATFHLSRSTFQPFRQVVVAGEHLVDEDRTQTVLQDAAGRLSASRIDRIVLEDRGQVRVTLLFKGTFPTRVRSRFFARLCFFAGTGLVRLRFTLHNPNRARHKGGLWDLGDPGSLLFRSLVLRLALNKVAAEQMSWKAEVDQAVCSSHVGPLEIYQDSSGGENWQSKNHVNRDGVVLCKFRGYRVQAGGAQQAGLRASPLVSLSGSGGSVAVGVPEFWQQFPKALAVEDQLLQIGLFPEQCADLFELQGGEQKTHTIWFRFGPASSCPETALGWVHEPARARATPEWYAASQTLEPFTAASSPSESRLDAYLGEVMNGATSLLKRREIIDEYGWRNFGEIYADHEMKYYEGPLPLISHFNNQYDVVFGSLLHYLRTGNAEWLDLADPLARHVIDIDIYHTNQDKAAYNGGLFWFTDHYKSAGTATHRTFSKDNCRPGDTTYGGGPASSHNFTAGLLHYYFLTGDRQARDAVVGLADWVIHMDDGRRNILGLVDDGPTGMASCTFELEYQGPGRGPGNSINALLDAWQLTGLRAYLEQAERLIQRCVHPNDDVASRELLNVETRWSYTVFLVALARYLGVKIEINETDDRYTYAQASLLRYARWMAENEIPYFDQAEKMEFPTEVWAAQELRKANVIRLAAAHADEPLRSRLMRRGDELADRAWSDLYRFESRTVARTAAIVFVEGLRDCCFRLHGTPQLPRPKHEGEFNTVRPFIPQRLRVKAELKSVRGLARMLVRLSNPLNWLKASRLFFTV